MEVAIRAINWVWALATLGPGRLDPPLERAVTASLQAHGRHIAANLEGTPDLRSNHYLANLLGLLVLGAVLEGDAEAPGWLELARRELEREIARCRCTRTASATRPRSATTASSWSSCSLARHVAAWAEAPLSAGFDERLRAMLGVSRALRHPGGRMPQLGDSDSGRILPAGRSRAPTHDHLLWLGAAVLGERAASTTLAGSEEVAWTLGLQAWREALSTRRGAGSGARRLPASAASTRSSGGGTHLVVRCGDVGQGGTAAMRHNDLLSFELSRGRRAARRRPRAPSPTRGPGGAKRVPVGARPQHDRRRRRGAEPDPARAALPAPPVRASRASRRWHVGDREIVFAGGHDGYRRLPGTVRPPADDHARPGHRRRGDRGRARRERAASGRVAAHPRARRAGATGPARTSSRSRPPGSASIPALELTVEEGWVSDRYGVRERAAVLVARAAAELPVHLLAHGSSPFARRIQPRRRDRWRSSSREAPPARRLRRRRLPSAVRRARLEGGAVARRRRVRRRPARPRLRPGGAAENPRRRRRGARAPVRPERPEGAARPRPRARPPLARDPRAPRRASTTSTTSTRPLRAGSPRGCGGARIVYDAHELFGEAPAGGTLSRLRARVELAIERMMLRASDAVVTTNASRARVARRALRARRGRDPGERASARRERRAARPGLPAGPAGAPLPGRRLRRVARLRADGAGPRAPRGRRPRHPRLRPARGLRADPRLGRGGGGLRASPLPSAPPLRRARADGRGGARRESSRSSPTASAPSSATRTSSTST